MSSFVSCLLFDNLFDVRGIFNYERQETMIKRIKQYSTIRVTTEVRDFINQAKGELSAEEFIMIKCLGKKKLPIRNLHFKIDNQYENLCSRCNKIENKGETICWYENIKTSFHYNCAIKEEKAFIDKNKDKLKYVKKCTFTNKCYHCSKSCLGKSVGHYMGRGKYFHIECATIEEKKALTDWHCNNHIGWKSICCKCKKTCEVGDTVYYNCIGENCCIKCFETLKEITKQLELEGMN